MGTNQDRNNIQNRFENLNLTFTDYDGQDEGSERKVSKKQKLNRHANAAVRAMKQMGGE